MFLFGQARASTFVGNGGNAGDIEVQVAFKVIQDTFSHIIEKQKDPQGKLCACYSDLEGHPICDTLKKLTEKQSQFCSDYLRAQAQGLSQTTQRISDFGFKMTRDQIEVSQKSGLRPVDAVANHKAQSLIVNQERFLDLQDYERVFLLTHELGHLHSWNGEEIEDAQSFGPFVGEEGGRLFLNAIAAATTMQALEFKILRKYHGYLNRSQGHKQHWVELSAFSTGLKKEEFGIEQSRGTEFTYRYQFLGSWGGSVSLRSAQGKKEHLTSTTAEESAMIYGIALNYRLFPFSNPMSYFGQSHLVVSLGIESLSGTYKINDTYSFTESKARSIAAAASLAYYLPIKFNLWVYNKIAVQGHKYAYEVPYRSISFTPESTLHLGVSYGF